MPALSHNSLVRLIAPAQMTDEEIMKFQSSLREVMLFIKYSKDKENLSRVLAANEKQVPYMKLQIGYGLNTNNEGKVNVLDVSPKLLEKMQNDPKAAKEYTQRLKDIEAATKWLDNYKKSIGHTVIVRYGYVDENGANLDLKI